MAWTTPRTWVAAEVPTASIFNTHVRDNLNALAPAPTSFTPTLGVWTLGNGTATGYWTQLPDMVFFQLKITFGSTSSFTAGEPTITLPSTPSSTYNSSDTVRVTMRASLTDNSGSGEIAAVPYNLSTNTIKLLYYNTATPVIGAVLSSTTPMTWATSDSIRVGGFYWV